MTRPKLTLIQGSSQKVIEHVPPITDSELIEAIFPFYSVGEGKTSVSSLLSLTITSKIDTDENGLPYQDVTDNKITYMLPPRTIPLTEEMVLDRLLSAEMQLKSGSPAHYFELGFGYQLAGMLHYYQDHLDHESAESPQTLLNKIINTVTICWHEGSYETLIKTLYGAIFKVLPVPTVSVICPLRLKERILSDLNSEIPLVRLGSFNVSFVFNEHERVKDKIYIVFNFDPNLCPMSPLNFGNTLFRDNKGDKTSKFPRFRLINSYPVLGAIHLW